MLPLLRDIRKEKSLDGTHIAALPVAYRTTAALPTFQSFGDMDSKYLELDCHTCTRFEFAQFAKTCVHDLNVAYIGTCCGGAPHHVRAMAEALGRRTLASEYSPDLKQHFVFGAADNHELLKENLSYRDAM